MPIYMDRHYVEGATRSAIAHGLVPHEILEVDPAIVEAFLGRVKDPTPLDTSPGKETELPIDAAFLAIMFTDLKDSTLMTTKFGDAKALH